EVVTSNEINTTLYPDLKFNFVRDIAPVAIIGGARYIMTVTPALPGKTVPEFIAYAKAHPGKINMGSAGIGTPPHAFGKLRALGVTSKTRSPALPDTPSISQFVPGYDASGQFGFGAPKGTPQPVID